MAETPTVNKMPPKKLQPSNLLPERSSGLIGALGVVGVETFADVVEDAVVDFWVVVEVVVLFVVVLAVSALVEVVVVVVVVELV